MRSPAQIARHLCDEAGFDPHVVNDRQLEAAVRRRLGNTLAAADYARQLEDDPAAREALLEELLVRESWFYRDLRPFEMLERMALGEWQHRATPLRILSAPCACGEEPYSIGMALMLGGLPPESFRIDAVDLSTQGLEKARAARYPGKALRDVPVRAEGLCFRRTAAGDCQIEESLRQRIDFRHGNLLEPGVLGREQSFDLVFCRNILIYLRAEARETLIDALERILAPDGLLVVGHAEAALLRERNVERHGAASSFAFRRVAVRSRAAQAQSVVAAGPKPAAIKPATTASLGRPMPLSAPLPARLPDCGARLAEAQALADRGSYADARSLVQAALTADPLCVEAQYLMGLLSAAQGAITDARRCLERALYLDPVHVPSLEHLALLSESAGDMQAAARLRGRAERAGSAA